MIDWIAQRIEDEDSIGDETCPEGVSDSVCDLNAWVLSIQSIRESILAGWLGQHTSPSLAQVASVIRFNQALDRYLMVHLGSWMESQERVRAVVTSVLSHDLMNILSAMMMGSSYLNIALPPDSTELMTAKSISQGGNKMTSLLRDLDDFIEHSDGSKLTLTPISLNMETVCRDVIEGVKKSNPGRDITLKCEEDVIGDWDFVRLTQMLTYLLQNAIQHGDESKFVDVMVSKAGEEALVKIHNWGDAISAENLAHLYSPASRKAYHKVEGIRGPKLGLGLFIAELIARSHRGHIAASSSQEEGTTFTVTLPLHPVLSNSAQS